MVQTHFINRDTAAQDQSLPGMEKACAPTQLCLIQAISLAVTPEHLLSSPSPVAQPVGMDASHHQKLCSLMPGTGWTCKDQVWRYQGGLGIKVVSKAW